VRWRSTLETDDSKVSRVLKKAGLEDARFSWARDLMIMPGQDVKARRCDENVCRILRFLVPTQPRLLVAYLPPPDPSDYSDSME
jgi:hypothetical protein